jgi:hypothetical protein
VCVCAGLEMGGERVPAVETERREGAPGYVRWGGKVQLKYGDGRILPYWLIRGAPMLLT